MLVLLAADEKLLFKELDELPPPLYKLPPPLSPVILLVLPNNDDDITFGAEVFKPSEDVGIAGFTKRSLVLRPCKINYEFLNFRLNEEK